MTEVHEDRTEDEILYKSMKARNNIAFEILLKTDNFTNLPVTQLPVLLGQCIPTHTKSVIRSGLASLAQIVQDRKLLILHGFHKGVLSQKRHQYFIDILEKMKGMLARQEDDRVSEGDKSCQPCESTTSSQKCLAPDEENGIFQEVCDDTMSANELYTLFDFVESTIDQMLKTWKTARAGKCDVASAAGGKRALFPD